jgi:6-phosphogluconate dehydrogenase
MRSSSVAETTGAQANIGVVGMAVMGSNLARNLASREGNTVAIYNRSYEKTQAVLDAHPEAGFVPAVDYKEFAASLQRPRTAIIMVKAGAATDAVITELTEVFEPGDIIVDGGNALFTDTIRREKTVRDTGINFVGAGISGGEEGAHSTARRSCPAAARRPGRRSAPSSSPSRRSPTASPVSPTSAPTAQATS